MHVLVYILRTIALSFYIDFHLISPFYFFLLHCSLRDINPRAEHSLSIFGPPMVVAQSKYTNTSLMECLRHGKNEFRLAGAYKIVSREIEMDSNCWSISGAR